MVIALNSFVIYGHFYGYMEPVFINDTNLFLFLQYNIFLKYDNLQGVICYQSQTLISQRLVIDM